MGEQSHKEALCIASVASNLDNFNRNNVMILQSLGYEVTLAANFSSKEDINSQEKVDAFAKEMRAIDVRIINIDFSRSPLKVAYQIKSILQVRKLLARKFDLIHCHTPVCSVIVRILAQKYRKKIGTKVFYTAHGFHFFKGAPLKNWLVFYPIEKWMSRYTDVLITINKEDYRRASKKFHAKKTVYIPGVGIDTEKFSRNLYSERKVTALRTELGLSSDEKMLLSVGDLNTIKNYESVIRALAVLGDSSLKYYICGTDEQKNYLEKFVEGLGLSENVKLLGYRTDISKLCDCADLFVFSSSQEVLPVALLEAIASKTPVICSNTHYNKGFVQGDAFFEFDNYTQIAEKIKMYINTNKSAEVEKNYQMLRKYDLRNVMKKVRSLHSEEPKYLESVYDIQKLRESMNIPLDSKLILSVGELNKNKNHEVVIRAIACLEDKTIHYMIAGTGELKDSLTELADQLGIGDRVHLLGYRSDIAVLYKTADLYIHPSIREGLSVALMEAISSKTPVICSNIRGNVDLVGSDMVFDCHDVYGVAKKIKFALKKDILESVEGNYKNLMKFDLIKVMARMKSLYS